MENKRNQYGYHATEEVSLSYDLPEINLTGFKSLTSHFGIRQFSYDDTYGSTNAGYALDDNAMALIIQCARFEAERDSADIAQMKTYFDFIRHCLQPEGYFLNYVDEKGNFTKQNDSCNLADINGKAIWALGRLISLSSILPEELHEAADAIMKQVLFKINTMHSKRAMAYTIKGLYYYNLEKRSDEVSDVIRGMANRLEQMYRHSAEKNWKWFEGYVEPGDCVLPEALLYAYSATGEILYKEISQSSFDFLLSHIFDKDNYVTVEQIQSTDLAGLIRALGAFHKEFNNGRYLLKMQNAFNLFISAEHFGAHKKIELYQCTTTTVNYLHARLIMETCFNKSTKAHFPNESLAKQRSYLPVLNVRGAG